MPAAAEDGRAIAVFDLDGTITAGDNYLAFLLHCLRRNPARLARCGALPWSVLAFRLRRIDNRALKERFLRAVLAGTERATVEDWANGYAELCVARMVKPKARARIARHKSQGDLLILASASLDLYVDRIGALLGFDHVVASRVLWRGDGCIEGTLAGPNLRGEEKVRALQAVLDNVPGRLVTAYTDDHSDLPLLAAADRAVAVDPTNRLAAEARRLGYTIERWR